MASDGSSLIPKVPDSLPSHLDPKGNPLGAFVEIIRSGIGTMMIATMVGIASIPLGIIIGVQKIVGGLTTWTEAFLAAFFAPFQAASCHLSYAGRCGSATLGLGEVNPVVQSAGIAGFVVAIGVVGAAMYVVAKGAGLW